MNPKTAIVYDRVNKWGGAERVLLALHEIFPDAPLYTSVYEPASAKWAGIFPKIHTSFLQRFSFARSHHELLGVLMPGAFKSLDLSGYDLVISVTSEAAKGITTGKNTLHICYCLTPTRYLWSHHDIYFKNPVLKLLSRPAVYFLRKWDKRTAKKPEIMLAISSEVKNRIKKYYKRDVEIIFPPVNINKTRAKGKGNYYLLVGRLDFGYKKVELAVETFNKLKKPLVIVGTGREKEKLKMMAKKNIKFAGRVTEKALDNYYRNAKALIMPQEEDFGIVAVEAQSYGVPVIAYKKGGAVDTVIQGKTGLFFEEQTPESLENAVTEFEKIKFKRKDLLANSKKFSKEVFKKKISDLIRKNASDK